MTVKLRYYDYNDPRISRGWRIIEFDKETFLDVCRKQEVAIDNFKKGSTMVCRINITHRHGTYITLVRKLSVDNRSSLGLFGLE